MKKFWKNYSYAIILVVLSFVGVFLYSVVDQPSSTDYLKITVGKGETLWQISEKYSDRHHFSKTEFVEWVERYNGISGDRIYAGEELMIPIENTPVEIEDITDLASR